MSRYSVVISAVVTTAVQVEAESLDEAAYLAEIAGPRYLLDENSKHITLGEWEADLDDTVVIK